jgi:hypothetical protein
MKKEHRSSFWLSLCALLIKNFHIKRRAWGVTLFEFALPVAFFIAFTLLKAGE